MKRKDFYQLILPLTDRLYKYAYFLLPDDLQAEQLLIDGLNAYLVKEKKEILQLEASLSSKAQSQALRKVFFKGILRNISEIGFRRSTQLSGTLKSVRPGEYAAFYDLDPKVRAVIGLRYEAQFNAEEIEEITKMPHYEVIEKLHNGRFLLVNKTPQGLEL